MGPGGGLSAGELAVTEVLETLWKSLVRNMITLWLGVQLEADTLLQGSSDASLL